MVESNYPCLVINQRKLHENVEMILRTCSDVGITVSGVIKGTNGLPVIIDSLFQAGMRYQASSRLSQLKRIKEYDSTIHTLALRIPMKSEIQQLIQFADCSLNSEIETLELLEKECSLLGIRHEVILMNDLGDLREGFFETEELLEAALLVENYCPHLFLKGIGTNLGCYGSIEPDETNLGKLVYHAQLIENRIGRKLDWISGGATTSLQLVLNAKIPKGITHLRIGDGIFLRDMELYFDYQFDQMNEDVFNLQGEIIELHQKPSYPIGTISVDAFGNKPEYIDIGNRKRALVAMGRQDIGDMTKLIPLDTAIHVIGGSSDHTIIDITDSKEEYKVGDIVKFNIQYENLLYSCMSEYVKKIMI